MDAYLTALEHPRFGPLGDQHISNTTTRDVDGSLEDDAGRDRGGSRSCLNGGENPAVRRIASSSSAGPEEMRKIEGQSMRAIAVHHLACYLFPSAANTNNKSGLPPSSGINIIGDRESSTSGDLETAGIAVPSEENPLHWRPDFARCKSFQRLLLLAGRGTGAASDVAASVAASVLSYECAGTLATERPGVRNEWGGRDSGSVSGGDPETSGRREQESEDCRERKSAARSNAEPPRNFTSSRAIPPGVSPCLLVSRLGGRRREQLRAYCREIDLAAVPGRCGGTVEAGTGIGNMGVWLQHERSAEEVVERLLICLQSGEAR